MTKRKNDVDAPEQDPAFFRRAKAGTAGMPSELVASIRRFRGKQKAPTKKLISLRVDQETLAAYQSTGPGWQSRMNDTLARAAKRLKAS
jgi:uncharacterized protein (DUF4415 family)